MANATSALRRIFKKTKRLPVIGSVVSTINGRRWRAVTERQWAARYAESPLVATHNDEPAPSLRGLSSQLCTALQFREPEYARWCREMRSPARLARKQWEFVFVLEALWRSGMFAGGRRGLGFGCGNEPLPAVMAKYGCEIVATDLDTREAAEKGWVDTDQHAATLDALNGFGICPDGIFRRRVSHEFANMNVIPEKFTGQFDFVWSCCAFEHLGSIRHGLDFVKNSIKCLRPGGVAVHTTEFNLSSNDDTLEDPGCVIFRRRDMEQLRAELEGEGYSVAPFNFNAGSEPVDHHIDAPPYAETPHLKIMLEGYVATSIGLIVRKP
ncbi:SAM-dependent methyltransferase [Paraburkholderia sp.]|uniref:SAM-dependent methyltransferase n=1 Tax=Paraburkholderia sp. TaxID=1926495 RepID=UPI0039E36F0A